MNFTEHTINNWKESKADYFGKLSGYVFRGQKDSSWQLSTTLERCLNRYTSEHIIRNRAEYWLIREFRRRFHLYSSNIPADNELIDWVALMQHHGAPTRLLDFTYSYYIALYFAIADSDNDAIVWAINLRSLWKQVHSQYDFSHDLNESLKDEINLNHIKLCNEIVKANQKEEHPFLIPVEPERLSERMSRQQGLFMMPASVSSSFQDNVLCTVNSGMDGEAIIKIIIPKKYHKDIIKDLTMMNITSESLFPGLDGFAQSLQQSVVRHF